MKKESKYLRITTLLATISAGILVLSFILGAIIWPGEDWFYSTNSAYRFISGIVSYSFLTTIVLILAGLLMYVFDKIDKVFNRK